MVHDKFDLIIAYRIYPGLSKASPLSNQNKYDLFKLCLNSFYHSINEISYYIYFILDSCPKIYSDYISSLFSKNFKILNFHKLGNQGSFMKQIEILSTQDLSDYVYFAEDDYFYLNNAMNEMLNFAASANGDFAITPYDHPDYGNNGLHSKTINGINLDSILWISRFSTTCTFLTTKNSLSNIKYGFQMYEKFGDFGMWLAITRPKITLSILIKTIFESDFRLYTFKILINYLFKSLSGSKAVLWSPLPSLATHMDSNYLSKSVIWDKHFRLESFD